MTDEERLQHIYPVVLSWAQSRCGLPTPSRDRDTLSRIRALLAEPLPTVEWRAEHNRTIGITRDTEIVIMPDGPREPPGHRILMTGLVEEPEWLDVYVLGDLASAQRRVVALYVALRGVT